MGATAASDTVTATARHGKRQRAAAALAKVGPMKNPSRERLKAELTLLRDQVGKLETHLLALQQPRPTQQQHRQPRHLAIGDRGTATRQYDTEHERDRRRASERENRRLRAQLWRQIRARRRTIAAMTGQTPETLGAGALFSLAPLAVHHASQLHDDYGRRFRLLLDDVDRAFTLLSEVFAPADVAADRDGPMPSPAPSAFAKMIQSRVFGQVEPQLVMEARENYVMAFDVPHCGDALWHAIEPSAFGLWDAEVRAVGADVKTARMRALHALHGATVQLTCTLVVKRFTLADRSVLVWRSVTSSDASDCDAYIDETGWSLCTRERADADGAETTRRRTCSQWVPRSVAEDRGSDRAVALAPKTGDFTKLVLAVSTQDTDAIAESMENLLIDDCMRDAGVESPTSMRSGMSSAGGSSHGSNDGSDSPLAEPTSSSETAYRVTF